MKLSLEERFCIRQVLPPQGSLVTLRIVRDLHENLAPTEEEIAEWEISEADGQVSWKRSSETERDFEITPGALKVIRDSFDQHQKAERLQLRALPVYERFLDAAEAPKLSAVQDA